jgi:hypothetical protein
LVREGDWRRDHCLGYIEGGVYKLGEKRGWGRMQRTEGKEEREEWGKGEDDGTRRRTDKTRVDQRQPRSITASMDR